MGSSKPDFFETPFLSGYAQVCRMLRFIFLNGFIAIFTIVWILYGLVLSIFDRSGRIMHLKCAVPWAKVILWVCGVRVKVNGKVHDEGDRPGIYMSNHQGIFDIFTLLACLPVDFKFVLKQELMKIPLFGFALKRARYISIDRENPRLAVKSMNEAAEKIRNGTSVLIFPEGTRSVDGQLLPFKRGGFHLALKAACDVVPISIVGSHLIVPKGSLRIKKGKIVMNIGEPIPVEGYSKKDTVQLMARVRDAMTNQMKESLE
jgi:1-acyl-sn-glycerol-3-phosphate acyltransferase